MPAIIEAIYIAPQEGEPVQPLEQVEALVERGLRGDRYCERAGHWSGVDECQVTLIHPGREGRIFGKAPAAPYTLMRLASLVPGELEVEIWDENWEYLDDKIRTVVTGEAYYTWPQIIKESMTLNQIPKKGYDEPRHQACDLLGLLDEVETVLGMQPIPMNWPVGGGDSFLGVYDRLTRQVYLYDRTARNQTISPETMTTLDDARIRAGLSQAQGADLHHHLELLDALGLQFNRELFLNGRQTPIYFGSALTNFGVQLFLDQFVAHAPTPRAYPSDAGLIEPDLAEFSGFVFKIQANMNPKHRDSVAFVRVCSGRFERNMLVNHPRTGKTMRLPRPYKFFADAREVIEEAYPGDIIGLPNNGHFAIGDTICANDTFNFAPIPRFPPEYFARLINLDVSKHKQFSKGLQQLETEGAMQVFHEVEAQRRDPILAVLGALQFEVVQTRLENEYRVPTRLEMLLHQLARRVAGPPEQIERLPWRYGTLRTQDRSGQLVALFRTHHEFDFYSEQYPELNFW